MVPGRGVHVEPTTYDISHFGRDYVAKMWSILFDIRDRSLCLVTMVIVIADSAVLLIIVGTVPNVRNIVFYHEQRVIGKPCWMGVCHDAITRVWRYSHSWQRRVGLYTCRAMRCLQCDRRTECSVRLFLRHLCVQHSGPELMFMCAVPVWTLSPKTHRT